MCFIHEAHLCLMWHKNCNAGGIVRWLLSMLLLISELLCTLPLYTCVMLLASVCIRVIRLNVCYINKDCSPQLCAYPNLNGPASLSLFVGNSWRHRLYLWIAFGASAHSLVLYWKTYLHSLVLYVFDASVHSLVLLKKVLAISERELIHLNKSLIGRWPIS